MECDAEAAHHALVAEAPIVAAPQVHDQGDIRDCDQREDQRVDVHGAI